MNTHRNKFKNAISVKGTKEELIAFAEKLEKLDYDSVNISGNIDWIDDANHLITYRGRGEYDFHNHSGGSKGLKFNLPEDEEKALAAASELEEERMHDAE